MANPQLENGHFRIANEMRQYVGVKDNLERDKKGA
jgi:hypothetical protein